MIRFLLLICCVVCLVLSGCSDNTLRKKLENFMRLEISFPEELEKISEREITCADIEVSKPTLVVYHDRLDCSSCEISHIYVWRGLYEYSKLAGFNIVTIFSPREDEYESTLRQLKTINFPYPVYIDRNDSFGRENRIPKDRRFHCFLIDTECHPIFVGNPLESNDLRDLFNRKIQTMES